MLLILDSRTIVKSSGPKMLKFSRTSAQNHWAPCMFTHPILREVEVIYFTDVLSKVVIGDDLHKGSTLRSIHRFPNNELVDVFT